MERGAASHKIVIFVRTIISMKNKLIYWISTGIFGAFMLFSAIPNLMVSADSVTLFKSLGYPEYLIPFLGVAKTLGVVALFLPGVPRLKEWAYAGLFYDLTGAMYSAVVIGGFSVPMLFMVVPYGA